MPTGPSIAQPVQIGRSQRPQRIQVSRSGWRKQCSVPSASGASGAIDSAVMAHLPRGSQAVTMPRAAALEGSLPRHSAGDEHARNPVVDRADLSRAAAQRAADPAAARRVRVLDRRLAVPRRARRPRLRADAGPGHPRDRRGRADAAVHRPVDPRGRHRRPLRPPDGPARQRPRPRRLHGRHGGPRRDSTVRWSSSPRSRSSPPASRRSSTRRSARWSRAWSATSASSGRRTRRGRRSTTSRGSWGRASPACSSRPATWPPRS